jgi:flavin-dependent dehydrogenase
LLSARILVAADGLGSPVRRREGLDAPAGGPERLGLRRHLEAAAPEAVEVHLGDGVEAYLTPAGAGRVGVAFLFERRHAASWEALLEGFPALRDRFAGAAPASEDRGAGPLGRRARARVRHRLALLGDAAGALDPLTGAGLTLALRGALDLAAILPEAVAGGADAGALGAWERAWRRRFLPAADAASAMLWLARHPAARRRALALAARRPAAVARLVAALG